MKKKDWIILGIVSAIYLLIMLVIYFVWRTDIDGHLLLALLGGSFGGYVVVVLLVVALSSRHSKRVTENFEMRISREGFSMQKVYTYNNEAASQSTTVAIDFDSKRFACNLLYKYIVPFERIAASRIEFAPRYTGILQDNKLVVSLVISVHEAYDEFKYFYISMFGVLVDGQDVGDNDDITPELLAKYPDLQQICDLQQDMLKLLEVNSSNGVAMHDATDEEWEQLAQNSDNVAKNGNIDQFGASDDQPHYTKPPFNDSRW